MCCGIGQGQAKRDFMSSDGGKARGGAGEGGRSAFWPRVLSTLVLWALVGSALVFAKPVLFFLLIGGLTVLGLLEYFRLIHIRHARGEANVTLAVSVVYISTCFWAATSGGTNDFRSFDLAALYVVTVSGFLIHLLQPVRPGMSHVAVMASVFGFVYIAFLMNFVTRISFLDDGMERDLEVPGRTYVLFLLAVTKFTDMGAYVVGSVAGRHKMVPHLSPGKTWEGLAGAVAFAYLAAFAVYFLFGEGMPLLTLRHTAILALLIAAGAVLGDLAESALKRSLKAKDAGQVLPGIGGVLDLIDSVLFTGPILYFYLQWLKA